MIVNNFNGTDFFFIFIFSRTLSKTEFLRKQDEFFPAKFGIKAKTLGPCLPTLGRALA
jgi:hypothetical protein